MFKFCGIILISEIEFFIFFGTKRVSRICSTEKGFKIHTSRMEEWFLARGYPAIVVNYQIDKKNAFGKGQCVKKTSEGGIPFLT